MVQLKVGKSHALVLTNEGKVYGWGLNNHGQVGFLDPADEQEPKSGAVVSQPVLVYPTTDMLSEMELVSIFDYAKQIEVYEDSSFLVTEEGALYSWGKVNESLTAIERERNPG